MIDSINTAIEQINSNISVLPTNNKKNLAKYMEYITENLNSFNKLFNECTEEIKSRREEIINRYNSISLKLEVDDMDYNNLKMSDVRCMSKEKLNLDYNLFKLKDSRESLETVNNIILEIINNFKSVGIELNERDFNHTEAVNLYVKTLLNSSSSIQDVFNEIFFKNPNLLEEISLNVWYIFYKNKSKIDAYYKNKYAKFDFHNYITTYRSGVRNNEYLAHNNAKYIYDLFVNKDLIINDFMDDKKTNDLLSSLLTDLNNTRNYENITSFRKSLLEYKTFKEYEYIVADLKELFTHKEEYKDLYANKLKEIAKEEKKLFGFNKKINKTGLFKLNPKKLSDTKLERTKTLELLSNLYKELGELDIKETIKNYFTNDTNYYDSLKLTTYNFNYFISLLAAKEVPITIENIDKYMLSLQKYLYDHDVDIIDNITLSVEKDIGKMISEMYQLNGIIVDEDKVNEQVDKIIEDSEKILVYYDINNLQINLDEIKFVIDSSSID